MFDAQKTKKEFSIFNHHPGLVYLDSAATSLKRRSVIEKEREYYEEYSANVHRGLYKIAQRATEEYEHTRSMVAEFINAASPEEIIFTRGTTEAINVVSNSRELENSLRGGGEIVTTIAEHHSNFVPWQEMARRTGRKLRIIDIDEDGFLEKIFPNPPFLKEGGIQILAFSYVSNVLGTINPVKEIIAAARKINPEIITVVDAAQAVGHMAVVVQDLGCDFFAFSAHKMFGPTGVGVLWGRHELLETLEPLHFGGEMVDAVGLTETTFKKPPARFEGGTPNIAGVVAFQEAIRFLRDLGVNAVREHERELTAHTLRLLAERFGDEIRILGPKDAKQRSGVISFAFEKYHPHDLAQLLSEKNIAVRAGHHCAMPLHTRLGIPASTRISFSVYNSKEDIERFAEELQGAQKILSGSLQGKKNTV